VPYLTTVDPAVVGSGKYKVNVVAVYLDAVSVDVDLAGVVPLST